MGKIRTALPVVVLCALISAGCSGGSNDSSVDVLFIGNSFTHLNDVPGMVETIADENGVSINTEMIAPGGAFLQEHVGNSAVTEAITSGTYEFVVLQEQSMAPAIRQVFRDETLPAAQSLESMAEAAGAQVIFFQTWGHENGNTITGHRNFSSMQTDLTWAYDELASTTGARVSRVGQAWERWLVNHPDQGLHSNDGVHAAPKGSYLAALVIAKTIAPGAITDTPAIGGVDEATAAALISAA